MQAATLPGPSLELVDTEASAHAGGHPSWPLSGAGGQEASAHAYNYVQFKNKIKLKTK